MDSGGELILSLAQFFKTCELKLCLIHMFIGAASGMVKLPSHPTLKDTMELSLMIL